jgi:hypothetical protein
VEEQERRDLDVLALQGSRAVDQKRGEKTPEYILSKTGSKFGVPKSHMRFIFRYQSFKKATQQNTMKQMIDV